MTAGRKTPDGEALPRKSAAERLLGVFISPGATFADIARQPDYLFPLAALVISSVAVTEALLAKIGIERIIRQALEMTGRARSMSPEQIQQVVERGATFQSVFSRLGGWVEKPLVVLVVAGLGMLILTFVFGEEVKFKAVFSVTCYAYLPSILRSLMALAVILFGDPDHFSLRNPAPSSVGFFLNPLEISKPVLALSSALDLFTVWFLILVAIGLSEATGSKVTALSISLIYFGLWMLLILAAMGVALLF